MINSSKEALRQRMNSIIDKPDGVKDILISGRR